jgi:hypothetical protein
MQSSSWATSVTRTRTVAAPPMQRPSTMSRRSSPTRRTTAVTLRMMSSRSCPVRSPMKLSVAR